MRETSHQTSQRAVAGTQPPRHAGGPPDAASADRGLRRGSVSMTRVVLLLAIGSVAALALLVPTTPLLGVLLLAAILGAAVAVLVRRSHRDRDERATLDDLVAAGYEVLHDRVAPGFAGTVRRLVIGPAGVFLVEVVDVTGRVRVRGDAVIVGGRSLALGPRLHGQLRAVSSALAPQLTAAGAHVTALVCMRRAELPLFRRTVAGIPLLREGGVVRRIVTSPSVIDEGTIAWIAELARSTMPPVGRGGDDADAGDGPRRRQRRPTARKRPVGSDGTSEPLSEAPSPA